MLGGWGQMAWGILLGGAPALDAATSYFCSYCTGITT